jgi:hypothetical protein
MANRQSGDDPATVFGTGDVLVDVVDVSLSVASTLGRLR